LQKLQGKDEMQDRKAGDEIKILVTGGTGNVGSRVVEELFKRDVEVRVLSRRQPEAGNLPTGVEVAIGDLLDPVRWNRRCRKSISSSCSMPWSPTN
jgi:nucleoside-diphosphate-sugar epimerase